MAQVFISYSSIDATQANEIVKALEDQGITCWIAPRDTRVGSIYTKDIPGAIRECPCFLLVLSPRSQESKWVNKELTQAINQEKRILPLMIEDFKISESIEFLLVDVQTRPYYQEKTETLREVLEEIRVLVPKAVPVSKAAPKPAAPESEIIPSFQTEGTHYQILMQGAARAGKSASLFNLITTINDITERYRKGMYLYQQEQYEQAAEQFLEAANLGHTEAQAMLGYCFECGKGVEKNIDAAISWYEKAAADGDPLAQVNLGVLCETGNHLPKDVKKAVQLYMKSAEQGNPNAQYNLGICYETGEGVPQDYKTAAKWYQKAAEQGHENAKQALQKLK